MPIGGNALVRLDKMAHSAPSDAPDEDFPDTDRNWEVQERAKRLRIAVRAAGGNQAIADRAGMPVGTLNRYIAGRDMKASAMVALAEACGVSLDWLATGHGSMKPGAPEAEEAERPRHLEMFGTVDMERMGNAMEITVRAFSARNTNPSWRRVAQVAMLIYDALGDPESAPEELAATLSAPGMEAKTS